MWRVEQLRQTDCYFYTPPPPTTTTPPPLLPATLLLILSFVVQYDTHSLYCYIGYCAQRKLLPIEIKHLQVRDNSHHLLNGVVYKV